MKTKRRKMLAQKQAAKRDRYKKPGTSPYARKAAYLRRLGLFGSQVPEPKPWK